MGKIQPIAYFNENKILLEHSHAYLPAVCDWVVVTETAWGHKAQSIYMLILHKQSLTTSGYKSIIYSAARVIVQKLMCDDYSCLKSYNNFSQSTE